MSRLFVVLRWRSGEVGVGYSVKANSGTEVGAGSISSRQRMLEILLSRGDGLSTPLAVATENERFR